jgi:hypothetical protein
MESPKRLTLMTTALTLGCLLYPTPSDGGIGCEARVNYVKCGVAEKPGTKNTRVCWNGCPGGRLSLYGLNEESGKSVLQTLKRTGAGCVDIDLSIVERPTGVFLEIGDDEGAMDATFVVCPGEYGYR